MSKAVKPQTLLQFSLAFQTFSLLSFVVVCSELGKKWAVVTNCEAVRLLTYDIIMGCQFKLGKMEFWDFCLNTTLDEYK